MELAPEEREFFRDAQPFGFILFARNCDPPAQVRIRGDSLRDAIGEDRAPIFTAQEGGRVARLKPPHWRARPPARWFGELFERSPEEGREATYLCARLIANDLRGLGVTANCTPVLGVPIACAPDIIRDRAVSSHPS